ncbi:unnamed protein product [Clonostachys solani]|uniref:Major facilitator superfamily (MFS) profile domain-containing protein n=1 Tax=Clonostachys solani TaxID=160281 RepID=A0A9N9ZNC3_9HYPO|nr:unnamed protein product [Clonostachys solani]
MESEPLIAGRGRDQHRGTEEALLSSEILEPTKEALPLAEIASGVYALFVAGLVASTLGPSSLPSCALFGLSWLVSSCDVMYDNIRNISNGVLFRPYYRRYDAALRPIDSLTSNKLTIRLPIQLEEYYQLSDKAISIIFLCPPVGFFLAAYFSRSLHLKCGRRVAVIIAPVCQLTYALTASQAPPFPVLLASLVAVGFFGLMDGSLYAWVGGMKPAKTVIGLLHGAFSIGAASGPFLANTITSAAHRPWYNWYYVLTAFVFLELPCLAYSFWQHDVESFHVENGRKNIRDEVEPDEEPSPQSSFGYTATWIGSAYVFAFMGVEFTVTGWGIAYMNRVNEGSNLLGGACVSLFHLGLAAGKLSLGVMTRYVPVQLLVTSFLCLALLSQVAFAVSTIPAVSVALMALLGFLLGPLYPSGIIMMTQLLPREVQVAGISFVNSMGQIGAAFMPFLFGLISNRFGIEMLVYYVCLQLALIIPLWLYFFRLH